MIIKIKYRNSLSHFGTTHHSDHFSVIWNYIGSLSLASMHTHVCIDGRIDNWDVFLVLGESRCRCTQILTDMGQLEDTEVPAGDRRLRGTISAIYDRLLRSDAFGNLRESEEMFTDGLFVQFIRVAAYAHDIST